LQWRQPVTLPAHQDAGTGTVRMPAWWDASRWKEQQITAWLPLVLLRSSAAAGID